MIYAIDFDGTIVTHKYPEIGDPVPGAIETMKSLVAAGHFIILWTMRSDETLQDAVDYLTEQGVALWGVNENPEQGWSNSPKAYAHVYIDDAAMGCPMIYPGDKSRPFVDWRKLFPC